MLKLVHRGFEAFISCDDGAKLEVHRASVAGAVASGWIASEPGRSFKITVNQARPETHFTLRVHLDGKRVEYLVTPGWQMRTLSTDGARPSPTTFTPFVFAAACPDSDSDEDAPAPDEATLREIGTIRLEVARVVLGAVYRSESTQTGDISPADVVRKRALGQHHIALGEERPGAPWIMRNWSVRPVDPRKPGPDAVFEFRYRPREFLHANGIIPRPKRAREPRLDNTHEDESVKRSAKVARLDADESEAPSTNSSGDIGVSTDASTDDTGPPAASSALDSSGLKAVGDTVRGGLPDTPRPDPVPVAS